MTEYFQEFVNNCWALHDKSTKEVAQKLQENLDLIQTDDQALGYTGLVVHTFGGHLGDYPEGIQLLKKILENESLTQFQPIYRGLAALSYCANEQEAFKKYFDLATEEGSAVRIYSSAASELTAQGNTSRAIQAFQMAVDLTPDDLVQGSPVARSMAISGNNLACELEEKKERSDEEEKLMLLAAHTARKYWEIAGSWVEVERAEYRLAMSHLQAGQLTEAFAHARLCKTICMENKADPFEQFFAHEALIKIHRAFCEDFKSQLSPEDQAYCPIP